MSDELSRYAVTDAPYFAPAHDWITKSTVGPFIDTGIDVAFGERGRIYLGFETIREMAQLAGMFQERPSVTENLHDTALYNQGYTDAMKENISGNIDSIAEQLGFVAHVLADLNLAPDLPGEPATAPVEPAEQGPRPRRSKRPADVSANPEPAAALRI